MDIYIKSFNRAYLLHRTIASIYHFLEGFSGKIVVLDDGTPQKYLDKIIELFPDIKIVKSPYYNQKSKDISLNKIPEKDIPAIFWRDEVLKGSEYFILLEDDMWFTRSINYINFTNQVYEKKMDMIKFMWLKNERLISKNIKTTTSFFNIIRPKVLTKKPLFFNDFFRTNNFKSKSVLSKLINYEDELLKYYQIFIVAGGVFSKKYYKKAWENSENEVDELFNISRIIKNIHAYNIGNTHSEMLRTTIKFSASNIKKEKLFNRLDVFDLNKILNEAWFMNKSFNLNDFESDVPSEWIKYCCENTPINYSDWKNWYEQFKASYEKIGCIIE